MEILWEELRRTYRNAAAADLVISDENAIVKYKVYLLNSIRLVFQTTDRSHAELAARLLKLAGISAEVRKAGNVWYVQVYKLATGREELRKALAKIVKEAVARGWVDEKKAERWLEKLERGLVLREELPNYDVRLSSTGALRVTFASVNPNNIMREAQRLENMGLEEGRHFTVKMPEGRKRGRVSILRRGLEHVAWLSVHGEGKQRELAAEFVAHILQRARKTGEDVYGKARDIVEGVKARGSLTLRGLAGEVEVNGARHVVKVIDVEAVFDRGKDGKELLRIKIAAEVDGVKSKYEIAFGKHGKKREEIAGYAVASAISPGGREADAERLAAVVKALTGEAPRIYRRKKGSVVIACGKMHIEGFRRYAELAEAVDRWLSR
jgi:hypothetical protein